MATRAMNFKMEESEIWDLKQVAAVFNLTATDIIKAGVKEYVEKLKKDPFYRLTASVQEADAEESEEILAEIDALSDDDLAIASTKRFTV